MVMPQLRHSDGNRRHTTERLLRYIMRRKPCVIIMCAQVVITLVLVVIVTTSAIIFKSQQEEIELLQEQLHLIEQRKQTQQSAHFSRCNHTAPMVNISDYDLSICQLATRGNPMAFTIHETSSRNCLARLNTVPCYEKSIIDNDIGIYQRTPISCAGLFKAPMPYTLATIKFMTLAPRISERNLGYLIGETLLAGDLYVRCPRCRVETNYYSKDKQSGNIGKRAQKCARRLYTITRGWPDIAEFCDKEEYSDRNTKDGIYCPK